MVVVCQVRLGEVKYCDGEYVQPIGVYSLFIITECMPHNQKYIHGCKQIYYLLYVHPGNYIILYYECVVTLLRHCCITVFHRREFYATVFFYR